MGARDGGVYRRSNGCGGCSAHRNNVVVCSPSTSSSLIAPHHLLLTLLLLILVGKQVSASGSFQLRLTSFVNDGRQTADGLCCGDVIPSTPPPPPSTQATASNSSRSTTSSRVRSGYSYDSNRTCTAPCRTFFYVCLSHYQASLNPAVDVVCTFGNETTAILSAESSATGSGSSLSNVDRLLLDIPLEFPFDFTWPGSFSLIVDAYHSPVSGYPRLISRTSLSRLVEAGTDWIPYSWTSSNYSESSSSSSSVLPASPRLQLSFRYLVVCADGYYGPGCSTSCQSRDDKFGHYGCSVNGSRVCMEGWSGPYCDKPVCPGGCNTDHGFCEVPNECRCRLGWQGPSCDECIAYPGCQFGTCDQPWQCNCREGWGGLFCNQDLNFCTNYRPCRNGATCTNTGQGSFTCTCAPGFTGTSCESSTDDCSHVPCQNGGSCSTDDNRCRCPAGYEGAFCERGVAVHCEQEEQQTRSIGPCLNGGSCRVASQQQDRSAGGSGGAAAGRYVTYQCTCLPGFIGYHCEDEIDECSSSPCLNDGRCVDVVNGYTCVCPQEFFGQRCETLRGNRCSADRPPCLNGGLCVDVPPDDFQCHCQPGFSGSLCQDIVDYCRARPCANGATCYDLVADYFCACAPGFSGRRCTETAIDACVYTPCGTGATCRSRGSSGSFECVCPPGKTGVRCDDEHDGGGGHGQSNFTGGGRGPASAAVVVVDRSALTVTQLILVAVLGGGIPVGALGAAVIVLLATRRRRRSASTVVESPTSVSGFSDVVGAVSDNARNDVMNNWKLNADGSGDGGRPTSGGGGTRTGSSCCASGGKSEADTDRKSPTSPATSDGGGSSSSNAGSRCAKISNVERERRTGNSGRLRTGSIGRQKVHEVNLLNDVTSCQCKTKRFGDESIDESRHVPYLTDYRSHPAVAISSSGPRKPPSPPPPPPPPHRQHQQQQQQHLITSATLPVRDSDHSVDSADSSGGGSVASVSSASGFGRRSACNPILQSAAAGLSPPPAAPSRRSSCDRFLATEV